ncbi:ATP-binding protein [Bacillus sp. FJAT-29814]|uniref:ATP-binding protein n=1 Tax=Bacillus sp. FJAT-29814 TaxID=1729688 RepID=UPI00082EBDC9|nr:ATP-binding protein [Bacillus sp. FJAT-29814]
MNNQIGYIGAKIKELSGDHVQRLNSAATNEILINPLLDKRECSKKVEANLCLLVGECLISQTAENKQNLIAFVKDLGLSLIITNATLNQSIHIFYRTRGSILDLLQQEVLGKRISIECYFEVMKMIEQLFQLMSKTLLKIYNEEIAFIRLALDDAEKDLTMTLKELADVERVLNEATIFAISDHEDKIIFANDNLCQLYKYSREELIGKPHRIFSSNYHPPSFFHEVWETIQSGEAWKGEILNQAKDGTKYWLDTTIIPFLDANGEHYKHISIQYDITEKRKSEEMIRKAEKLSMIGELAAGIAHEIRNPLTTIRGFVQLLNNNGINPYYADTILDEIDRINFIVSELMVFAKPHQVVFRDCNITSILHSVIKFLEPEANLKNVNIDCQFPTEEVVISGEKNQLKQVFINLIKNAIEAMPSGGNVSVVVERTSHNVVITVKDEGKGMEAEQIKRLGEPFFTTKQDGNGLGLMVSYKIIQNHKGLIHVVSELNQGTTFTISFDTPQSGGDRPSAIESGFLDEKSS